MITCIPTDDGVTVSDHFGRSKQFLIVKIEKGNLIEKNLIENPHNREKDELVGHGSVLKVLTDNKVTKVLCTNLGPRMLDNLGSLKIAVERIGQNSRIEDVLREEATKN